MRWLPHFLPCGGLCQTSLVPSGFLRNGLKSCFFERRPLMCRDYNRLLGYSSEALLLSAGLQTAASFSLLSVFDQATTSDRFHREQRLVSLIGSGNLPSFTRAHTVETPMFSSSATCFTSRRRTPRLLLSVFRFFMVCLLYKRSGTPCLKSRL